MFSSIIQDAQIFSACTRYSVFENEKRFYVSYSALFSTRCYHKCLITLYALLMRPKLSFNWLYLLCAHQKYSSTCFCICFQFRLNNCFLITGKQSWSDCVRYGREKRPWITTKLQGRHLLNNSQKLVMKMLLSCHPSTRKAPKLWTIIQILMIRLLLCKAKLLWNGKLISS